MLAASAAKAGTAGAPVAPVPARAATAAAMSPYHARTASGVTWARPSARVMTAAASGPATAALSSADRPAEAPAVRRAASAAAKPARPPSAAGRNACANGARCRPCAAPSSDSMLGPVTRAVVNLGSSTVNVPESCRTRAASPWLVTSQALSAGTQQTGSRARSRASAGCGSPASSAAVGSTAGSYPGIRRLPGPSALQRFAGHQGDDREAEGGDGQDDDKGDFHRVGRSGGRGLEEDRRDRSRADR